MDLLGFQGTEFIQLLAQRKHQLLSVALARAGLFANGAPLAGPVTIQSEEEKRLRRQLRKQEKKLKKRSEKEEEEDFIFDAQQLRLERLETVCGRWCVQQSYMFSEKRP